MNYVASRIASLKRGVNESLRLTSSSIHIQRISVNLSIFLGAFLRFLKLFFQQTAAILREGYPAVSVAELQPLAPGGSRGDILAWLTRHPQVDPIALVGHEPDLGELVSWMISGKPAKGAGIAFKKGGAAFVEFPASPEAGTAILRWLLQPGHLRKL